MALGNGVLTPEMLEVLGILPPRPGLENYQEIYVTGTGQRIRVHNRDRCEGEHCVIHNPSDHSMRDFPTHWRADRQLMERICPHGIGHPDPDSIAFIRRMDGEKRAGIESVHGCDGCCAKEEANGV